MHHIPQCPQYKVPGEKFYSKIQDTHSFASLNKIILLSTDKKIMLLNQDRAGHFYQYIIWENIDLVREDLGLTS